MTSSTPGGALLRFIATTSRRAIELAPGQLPRLYSCNCAGETTHHGVDVLVVRPDAAITVVVASLNFTVRRSPTAAIEFKDIVMVQLCVCWCVCEWNLLLIAIWPDRKPLKICNEARGTIMIRAAVQNSGCH